MVEISPVAAADAGLLFPLVFQSPITDTLLWDGPESLDEFRSGLTEFAEDTRGGKKHVFTIRVEGRVAGTIDVRPYSDGYRASVGLWIGEPYQGRGAGTTAIGLVCEYGFARLNLEKIEAFVFVGNDRSLRAFEKNGFLLEGTIRRAVKKRGTYRDEWLLGLLREEYLR